MTPLLKTTFAAWTENRNPDTELALFTILKRLSRAKLSRVYWLPRYVARDLATDTASDILLNLSRRTKTVQNWDNYVWVITMRRYLDWRNAVRKRNKENFVPDDVVDHFYMFQTGEASEVHHYAPLMTPEMTVVVREVVDRAEAVVRDMLDRVPWTGAKGRLGRRVLLRAFAGEETYLKMFPPFESVRLRFLYNLGRMLIRRQVSEFELHRAIERVSR